MCVNKLTLVITMDTTRLNDFSITLPSNVDKSADRENVPSKYVTRFVRPIRLDGPWEVAATRLQYQNNWSTTVEKQQFGVFLRSIKTLGSSAFLASTGANDQASLSDIINFRLQASQWTRAPWADHVFWSNMHFRRVTLPTQKYDTVMKLGRVFASAISTAFHSIHDDLKVRYEIDRKSARVRLVCSGQTDGATYVMRIVTLTDSALRYDADVMDILGFTPSETGTIETASKTWKFYGGIVVPSQNDVQQMSRSQIIDLCQVDAYYSSLPQMPAERQLLLYCDLVEHRPVGDKEAQLLDTVVVTSNFGQMEDALRGTKPNYVPVRKNPIDSIEIKITDHAGELIEFTNPYSPVMVQLHLRRSRNRR